MNFNRLPQLTQVQELNIKFLDAGKISGIKMHELDGMHLTAEAHRLLAEELKNYF